MTNVALPQRSGPLPASRRESSQPSQRTQPDYRVTPVRVLRSEWTKFWSVRSTGRTLLAAVVLTVGLAALVCAIAASNYSSMSAHDLATFDATSQSLSGLTFAELAIGVLGVLVISGEYTTGMIRSSLTVVPKRLPVLWSKVIVVAAVTFVAMLVAAFAAFFLGQALLSGHDLNTTIGAPGALRSVIGAALAVSVIAVIGVALGSLLRNTAAAISTFVGVFFVLPPLASLLPGSIGDTLPKYLPGNAASALFGGHTSDSGLLSPWAGFAVLCGYALVLVALAALRLRDRDA